MKFKISFACMLLAAWIGFVRCKNSDTTPTSTSASISALTCASTTFSTTAVAATAYTGVASVPYTGGNGAAYTTGSAIASTGVTGLTATLVASTLATGAGTLTYAITGTPSASGTATFAISFGGQSCSFALTVNASGSGGSGSSGTGLGITTDVSTIVTLAEAFKATLSSTQLAACQLTYTKANAVRWSNLPQALYSAKRVGLATSTLSTEQWTALKNLLKAMTGTAANEGNDEMLGILAADDYLNANGGGSTYGSGNYYIAFLGTPSTTGLFEIQFGGHHGTVANTYNAGKLAGATPSFRSTEPFPTYTWNGVAYQPIQQELSALSAMLKGLSTSELSTAKRSSSQTDLILGPGQDGVFPSTKTGIKVANLSATQKALVLAAIKTYTDDLDASSASAILTKYSDELDNTYISYSGTTDLTSQGDYVLIDGPSVWIEFSMQSGIVIRTGNHPHSVWRDRTGDYGGN